MRKALFLVLFVSFISLISNALEAKFDYFDLPNAISDKVGDITLKYSKGEGSSAPSVSNSALRLKPKNIITLSCADKFVIEKIEFKYLTAIDFPLVFSQTGNYETISTKNHIWTGVGNSGVTITNALGITKNAEIKILIVTYSIKVQVEKPEFSVAEGSYLDAQDVEIISKTADSKIYYTIDGSIPSLSIGDVIEGSTALYTGMLTVDRSMEIKAIAVKDGKSSEVATSSYKIYKANDEITATINFPDLATDYLPTSTTEFVSLKNITLIDPSNRFTVESLSEPNQTNYPSYYNEGFASLNAGSQFKISANQPDIIIEKILLKMYETPSGFVYINNKKSSSIYDDNIIEWDGTALATLNILNPNYESNGEERKIVEIKITYRQAKPVNSVDDILSSITNCETGYIATNMQLCVGYHQNNHLYATDGTSWMLLKSEDLYGGNRYSNGDIITDKIVGKMHIGQGATITPLNPFTSIKGSVSLSAEPLVISTLLTDTQLNKYVQLKWATYNGTTNMLSDATGSIEVDPQFGIILTDRESYTLRGFVGKHSQAKVDVTATGYIFYPTEIEEITTSKETPIITATITVTTPPGTLCITTQHPQQIAIYTTAGTLHSTHNITSGTTQIPLSQGYYIVTSTTSTHPYKVIVR